MVNRAKFRSMLMHWVWNMTDRLSDEEMNSDEFDEFEKRLKELGCDYAGHQPERDQCGNPDHDYCLFCGLNMPGQAG